MSGTVSAKADTIEINSYFYAAVTAASTTSIVSGAYAKVTAGLDSTVRASLPSFTVNFSLKFATEVFCYNKSLSNMKAVSVNVKSALRQVKQYSSRIDSTASFKLIAKDKTASFASKTDLDTHTTDITNKLKEITDKDTENSNSLTEVCTAVDSKINDLNTVRNDTKEIVNTIKQTVNDYNEVVQQYKSVTSQKTIIFSDDKKNFVNYIID